LDNTYMVGAFVSVGVDGDAQVGGEGEEVRTAAHGRGGQRRGIAEGVTVVRVGRQDWGVGTNRVDEKKIVFRRNALQITIL
jgi:hypothetical protein